MSEEEKLLKEAKKLPWKDWLVHKNWKVKSKANVDLATICNSISDLKDPRLREFGKWMDRLIEGELLVQMCYRFTSLVKTLGIGSFGKVKIAKHARTGHKVAIKILDQRKIKSMEMEEKVGKPSKAFRPDFHPTYGVYPQQQHSLQDRCSGSRNGDLNV